MIRNIATFVLFCLPCIGMAQELRLPGNAVATYQEAGAPDTLQIATGPWSQGAMTNVTAEGTVAQSAWKISVAGLTTLQILQPLRDQLLADGYEELFTCDTNACGGFDFRFALDILPPPKMQVNLGDFRYWSGTKTGDAGPEHIALTISQIAQAAYVQIDRISNSGDLGRVSTRGTAIAATASRPSASAQTNGTPVDLNTALSTIGRAVLDDLSFAPGSADLDTGSYPSLEALAEFLKSNPTLQVALVGHTDSAGSLEGNIGLSKRRARAVRDRLINSYGIPSSQLAAEGMGYLSPVDSNLTEVGRNANRRVEAIVTSTDQN
jgi:OOP family OmpA-OmpF porin